LLQLQCYETRLVGDSHCHILGDYYMDNQFQQLRLDLEHFFSLTSPWPMSTREHLHLHQASFFLLRSNLDFPIQSSHFPHPGSQKCWDENIPPVRFTFIPHNSFSHTGLNRRVLYISLENLEARLIDFLFSFENLLMPCASIMIPVFRMKNPRSSPHPDLVGELMHDCAQAEESKGELPRQS
jgi:hypothetical protein